MSSPAFDSTAHRAMFDSTFLYINGFRRNTHRYATATAMIDPASGRNWTYAELGADVDRLAAGLVSVLNLAPGELVSYQLLNGPEFAQLYLATQVAGAVGAPINFRLAPGETAYLIDSNQPKVFVYDTALSANAATALARASHVPQFVVSVGAGELIDVPVGATALRLADLFVDGPVPQVQRTAWDETTRLFTSGSTGMPKGVPLDNTAEILTAHDVIMHFPLASDDRVLNMTPWFHRGGLYAGGPAPSFYVGAQVVPLRAFDAALVLDYVEKFGLTFLVGAPTNLELLAREQVRHPRDLSTLRGIVSMGAPLEREAARHYQEVLTPRIFNGYGTTEAFWNTFLRPVDLPDMAGTAGRACTDDDVLVVKLFDDRLAEPHETVAKDSTEIGEVIVRSPKCTYAYIANPAQEKAKFREGWLHIGDLATWDEGEYISIVGRKDDMLVSGGENVHPQQVEEVLNEHAGIADSMVVSVPDEEWGQLVVAYVVRSDNSLTVADCETYCRSHPMLSTYKRPRAYRFVEEIPVSATGKKVHYVAARNAKTDFANGLFTLTALAPRV